MSELTPIAWEALQFLYSAYNQRMDKGQRKDEAVRFTSVDVCDGFDNAKDELYDAGFITKNVLGEYFLTEDAISFMSDFT